MSHMMTGPKGSALPQMIHHITDPLRRSRIFWGAVCWVIAFVLGGFGSVLLVGGLHSTAVPSAYEAITRYIPGGVRTYGGIMLALSLSLVHGLIPPAHGRMMFDRWLHITLVMTQYFAVGVVAAFGASWALTGTITFQAMIYWGSIAALAYIAATFPPDPAVRPARVA